MTHILWKQRIIAKQNIKGSDKMNQKCHLCVGFDNCLVNGKGRLTIDNKSVEPDCFIKSKYGYRTETFSGSGIRDIREVIYFETFELGNTCILEYLLSLNIFNTPIQDMLLLLSDSNKEISEEDAKEFVDKLVSELEKRMGMKIPYALWLTSESVVKSYYGKDIQSKEDVDKYLVSDIILADIGYDGTLYGYTNLPKPVSETELEEEKCYLEKEPLPILTKERYALLWNAISPFGDKDKLPKGLLPTDME